MKKVAKAVLLASLTAAVAFPAASFAQELRFNFDPEHFRFDQDDHRANEGKRAACSVYAQIAVVQADANRRFNCGYQGARWDNDTRPHFRWCRYTSREDVRHAQRDRAEDLQRCFDRLGDFDEAKNDHDHDHDRYDR